MSKIFNFLEGIFLLAGIVAIAGFIFGVGFWFACKVVGC